MEGVLWQLLASSRGADTRVRLLQAIEERPRNPNQLADAFIGWYEVTTPTVQASMAALCGLETVALLAVARITWR